MNKDSLQIKRQLLTLKNTINITGFWFQFRKLFYLAPGTTAIQRLLKILEHWGIIVKLKLFHTF